MDKLFVVGLVFLVLAGTAALPVERLGDTSNYYLMTLSLLHDHDLIYNQKDAGRMGQIRFGDVPAGTILIFSGGSYYFGKPYLYSLINVPFFTVLGKRCFLFVNLVMFCLMLQLSYRHLRQYNPAGSAYGFTLLFFFLSVVPFYIFWIHEEIFYFFLGFLFFHRLQAYQRNPAARTALYQAAVIAGIATAGKLINGLLLLPLLAMIPWRDRRTAFVSLVLAVLPVISILGFYYLHTGVPTYFSGTIREMYYRFDQMPFSDPANPFASRGRNVVLEQMAPGANWHFLFPNLFYFFCGRYSGILPYFPPLIAAVLLYKNRSRVGFLLILLGLLWALGLCLGRPHNYFGGAPLGNRYFHLFPAFILLVTTITWRPIIVAVVLVAALFVLPFYSHPVAHSHMPYSHGVWFPYRHLPLEKTQVRGLPFWGVPISPMPGKPVARNIRPRTINYGDVYLFFTDFSAEVHNHYWVVPGGTRTTALLEVAADREQSYALKLINLNNRPAAVDIQLGKHMQPVILGPGQAHLLPLPAATSKPLRRIDKYWNQEWLTLAASGGDILAEVVYAGN